ncbi:LacI family DNA-binding transcriptional regulator [Devosia sp. ZB163]|uniref:LacI family DNA-binding transcriptional regulator n=1 Tax=Devosia sp. ZB163 TaxID=3025938 RepID=UPI00235FBB41|nr:LacI family DNA-binding transcriptional regulator [Devosia sp. ZB163]MDC9822568.1 LacI family DNA-binding transcriptional regulator [Devosia sp. ZB163]
MDETRRRATVHDVAREAGVSLATVDRVLNGRPGVRSETAEKVAEAIKALDFRRDLSASLLARARDLGVSFLIPDNRNEFMLRLIDAIERRASQSKGERLRIDTQRVHAFDPAALATALGALDPKSCDCAVVVATEDDVVRRAIDQAHRRGIAVVTLVSDLPGSARRHFVGIDNHAAGRTAASLLGRFVRPGPIGIIAGSLSLADHHQRREGFEAVLKSEFAGHEIVGPFEGFDDDARTEAAAAELLSRPLAGIYNLGAGNDGLIRALESSGQAGKVRVVAHELTAATRKGLASGAIDVVIDQNPDGEIAAALAIARSLALGQDDGRLLAPIEIGLYLRDNLPKG